MKEQSAKDVLIRIEDLPNELKGTCGRDEDQQIHPPPHKKPLDTIQT
jgi:hypothetical protein